jgi:hypothetical protein
LSFLPFLRLLLLQLLLSMPQLHQLLQKHHQLLQLPLLLKRLLLNQLLVVD